jgi:hypothetical protein
MGPTMALCEDYRLLKTCRLHAGLGSTEIIDKHRCQMTEISAQKKKLKTGQNNYFLDGKKGGRIFSRSSRKEAGKYLKLIYEGKPPYFIEYLQLLIVNIVNK